MFYFDESGDLGVPEKSNTDFFVIAIFLDNDLNLINKFILDFRKDISLKEYVNLKWNKLNKESRGIFKKKYKKILEDQICLIYCDKRNLDLHGEQLYINMLYKLLKENLIQGDIKFDGDHLLKVVEIVRKKLKSYYQKVHFHNSKTADFEGIVIADLYAGFLLSELENKLSFEFKNIIKF